MRNSQVTFFPCVTLNLSNESFFQKFFKLKLIRTLKLWNLEFLISKNTTGHKKNGVVYQVPSLSREGHNSVLLSHLRYWVLWERNFPFSFSGFCLAFPIPLAHFRLVSLSSSLDLSVISTTETLHERPRRLKSAEYYQCIKPAHKSPLPVSSR